MNVISVDLPWKEETKGRRALATADLDANIKIDRANDDTELLSKIRSNSMPGSIILLDIPVDGCRTLRNVKGKRFRPIDKTLAHQGIWIQPSYTANMRGQHLLLSLEGLKVFEIYPYAVYKFLSYLKTKKLLPNLLLDRFDSLLETDFRAYTPPKYKREKRRSKRQENMEYLYHLINEVSSGLKYKISLQYPDASSDFSQLSDEYDSCLGAIAGIYFTNNSSYACVAGDSNSGNVLLLADQWLQAQFKKEVDVRSRVG